MSYAGSAPNRYARPNRPNYVPPHLRSGPPRGGRGRGTDVAGYGSVAPRGGRGRGGAPYRPYYSSPAVSDPFSDVATAGSDAPNGDAEAQTDSSAINFDAYEDIPVEATGESVPPPASTFSEIDLGHALDANIARCGYTRPTPVQRHAIPIAAAGRDLMACAQTGSGKTAAFCFPIISGIVKGRSGVGGGVGRGVGGGVLAEPLALILSPTRELSCQIYEEARKFSHQTGVKTVVAYGGAPISQQLRNLERGVDILVATPGRLVDMIERQRVSLEKIKYLALDEADRMLDMGFEPQIRKLVEQMGMPPPGSRQTLLFSATFPAEIQQLASDFLSNYIFLSVGRVGSSTDLISQKVELVQEMDKKNVLMEILRGQLANGSRGKLALTLIFVETKRGADALERWLSRSGFPAIAIHGDKVQMERERALKSFKSGVTPVLVATDVASRGLDIPHVAHVINFDLPKDIDDYVHRIGRTGRAGKSGLATAFFSDKNMPMAKSLVELMQEANQVVPSWLTQYAESNSGYGNAGSRSRRGGGGGNKFGGRDFRSNNNNHGNSNNYGSNDNYQNYYGGGGNDYNSHSAGSYGGDMSSYYAPPSGAYTGYDNTYGAVAYAGAAAPEYAYDYGTVVASGWE